jgi:hypothetical protein
MAKKGKIWMLSGKAASTKSPKPDFSEFEREKITAACERVIQEFLKSKFLPEIKIHTDFNYPVDIFGKWQGSKYRFITRYRAPEQNGTKSEFDSPFARLDYLAPDSFDLLWYRHTGTWHLVGQRLKLTEALETLTNSGIFHPC